jgi:membrane fusion protein, multidrug efflux system
MKFSTGKADPMRRHKAAIALSVILATLSFGSTGTRAEEAEATPVVRPVLWVEAKAEHAGLLDFVGTVQPRVHVDLAFRTLGRVISRNVNIGSVVKAGDILMTLDPLALKFALRMSEANLRSAEASLENARLVAERKQKLVSSNTVSQVDVDLAQQSLVSAQASRDQSQASLDKARQQLSYAELKADFDGVITSTSAEVGQTVALGQTVLTLARLDQRDAVVDVPEALLRPIRNTPEITVELQLDKTVTAEGTLREIAPEADPTTRTYRVKIAIDGAPQAFRLGSVVTVHFSTEDGAEVIRLPKSSIFSKDGKDYVWLIDEKDSAVRLTELKIDPPSADATYVRVLSGVSRGDKIVAAGVDQLKDGETVKLGQERRS